MHGDSTPASNHPTGEPDTPASTARCVECRQEVEIRFMKDGEYCFECAVHAACACADPTPAD